MGFEEYYLTRKQLLYAFDVNNVSEGTGFFKGAVVNPKIAHAISVRGGGGWQRANVSNFVSPDLPEEFPGEKVREWLVEYEKDIQDH